jgi:KipI family sensor histidine kinase inhibitor
MVEPFGDGALRFGLQNADRRALDQALRALVGVTDVVFGEEVGLVVGEGADLAQRVYAALSDTRDTSDVTPALFARTTVLDTCYDGPDLARVSAWSGLSIDEVIARHAARTYTALYIGFLPGFAYLGSVDPSIAAPRLPSPRARVPAGSVGIAAERTGVYPLVSPGGWNLVGRVAAPMFDPLTGARVRAGDRVVFRPVEVLHAETGSRPPPDDERSRAQTGPRLAILAAIGPAWIQDGGRVGHLSEGVPTGGALIPERLAAANRAVGNPPNTPAIELFGSVTVAARNGDLWLGWDGAPTRLARDHVRQFQANGPAYLAVAGGLDAPLVLGGRGALPVLGGVGLVGQLLGVGVHERSVGTPDVGSHTTFDPDAPIHVSPGPASSGLAALLATEWRVGSSDRTGTRLLGAPLYSLGADLLPSAPMVRGAIQVPAGGGPVVLGPDHPTTGGYPVVAVVRRADHGAFAARTVGARVRFVVG